MIGKIIRIAKDGIELIKGLLKKETLNPPLGKSKAQEIIDKALDKQRKQ